MNRRWSFLVPLLMLAACGSKPPEAVPPEPLKSFEARFDVDRLWHRDAGVGVRRTALDLPPAISERYVHVADLNGRLQAFERASGDRVWRRETGLRPGGLASGYGLLVVGSRDGELVAFSVEDGSEEWRTDLSGEVLAAPALDGSRVVVRTVDGRVASFDLTSGEKQWSYEEVVPVLTLRGTSSPVIRGNQVYVAFASGKVSALDAQTGLPLWERRIAEPSGRSELERMVDVDGNLVVESGGVFAASFQGQLVLLEQGSGRPFWEKPMSTWQRMAHAAGTLFVTDEDGTVWSIDQRSGAALWKNESFRGRKLTGTAVQSGLVVFGDAEGYLHWLDAIDGNQVARRLFDPDGFAATPRSYDDTLYVLSRDGELAAYDVAPK